MCFFSFSGYGLQVDDVDTMPDEGLDEAILPLPCVQSGLIYIYIYSYIYIT